MADPIDEYVVQTLSTYDGKKLQNIAKAGLSFGEDEGINSTSSLMLILISICR